MRSKSGKLVFVGPQWLIDLMKKFYGDSIDYVLQEKIPCA